MRVTSETSFIADPANGLLRSALHSTLAGRTEMPHNVTDPFFPVNHYGQSHPFRQVWQRLDDK